MDNLVVGDDAVDLVGNPPSSSTAICDQPPLCDPLVSSEQRDLGTEVIDTSILGESDSESIGAVDDAELDPLFAAPDLFAGWDASKDPEWAMEEEGELRNSSRDESESVKKKRKRTKSNRSSSDAEEEEKNAGKKKTKPKESLREKRKVEKERRAELERIHAESQRLLRETRNASFKPVSFAEKPISSVLEKIRKRKLEVLKSFGVSCHPESYMDAECLSRQVPETPVRCEKRGDGSEELEPVVQFADSGSSRSPSIVSASFRDNELSMRLKSGICVNSQTSRNSMIKNDDNTLSALSSPDASSDHDPDHNAADESSSEEDSDKENVVPLYENVDKDPCPKSNIAKDFIDDEAEEEDDSDHDLMRFQENEEDDESDEDDIANDFIATGFEEVHKDHETRNEIHQKWLEEQDADAMENILQRLQCRHVNNGNNDEEADKLSDDETKHERIASKGHKRSKKAKVIIAQMFADDNDAYIHSDEEVAEEALIRHRILRQNEERGSFTSPIDDENSREVFGLIKKLNIASNPKKKGKASTSGFDLLVSGGNSSSSSKSSFLGRAITNSRTYAQKQGSSTVRTFIFGRDDSSSRSGISVVNPSDTVQKEKQQPKATFAKLNNSQSIAADLKAKRETTTSSGASLFQILQQSSIEFDKKIGSRDTSCGTKETQAALQFSAFKLAKKVSGIQAKH